MKRKYMILAALLIFMPLLGGCRQQPPEGLIKDSADSAVIIDAVPVSSAARQATDTLYFGYGDTGLLRQESRQITLLPNETREKALVRALLEGSRDAGSRPLFPEKTEVLSTQAQDSVIYITFNESLYDRYADGDTLQRRQLALDALTATLTESGEYRSVQVLVRAEENVGRSMRLTTRFFREEEEEAVPPLLRRSASLPTPSAYAVALLTAWQRQDPEALSAFVSSREEWTQSALSGDLAAADALLSFAVYDGTVSPDGGSAVVCADLVLRDRDGAETMMDACPLRLVSEGGAWKILRSQLLNIMGEKNE
ncbi:MAG: GerMN domain-containing protein [Clostridia bacterium]|nr:GerMN domain-containing protein [Clostridia bacterium]